jgi:hypothetical protein
MANVFMHQLISRDAYLSLNFSIKNNQCDRRQLLTNLDLIYRKETIQAWFGHSAVLKPPPTQIKIEKQELLA